MTMIESIGDVTAYQKFTDGVLDYIMMRNDAALKEAKGILNRIYKRDLYKCFLETSPTDVTESKQTEEDPENVIKQMLTKYFGPDTTWIVEKVEFKTGFKDVYFYKKGKENEFFRLKVPGTTQDDGETETATDVEVSLLLPKTLKERVYRVYTKTPRVKSKEQEAEFEENKKCVKEELEKKGIMFNPLI